MMRSTFARAAGALAFSLVSASSTFAGSGPSRCLPPPDCKDMACCKMPDKCAFLRGLADTKARHDFYGSSKARATAATEAKAGLCNRYAPGTNWNGVGQPPTACATALGDPQLNDNKAAEQMMNDLGKFGMTKEEMNKKYPCPSGPGLLAMTLITDEKSPGCEVTAQKQDEKTLEMVRASMPEFDSQDACQEFLDAAKHHEEEHQRVCRALHGDGRSAIIKELGGHPGTSLAGTANDEKRGYARELKELYDDLRAAVHRCSVAKKQRASKMKDLKDALKALKGEKSEKDLKDL